MSISGLPADPAPPPGRRPAAYEGAAPQEAGLRLLYGLGLVRSRRSARQANDLLHVLVYLLEGAR